MCVQKGGSQFLPRLKYPCEDFMTTKEEADKRRESESEARDERDKEMSENYLRELYKEEKK